MGGFTRRFTIAVLVSGALIGSYPAVVAAQEDAPPPLFFDTGADGDLEISQSHDVELVSNLDEPVVVRLAARLPDFPVMGSEPVAGSSVLLVPDAVRVPAGQKVEVPLVVRGLDEVEPGVERRGEITAIVGDRRARMSVVVAAPEAAATAPAFAASEWTVTKTRRLGGDGVKGALVPLRPVADGAELPEVLGLLQDSDGDRLVVRGELEGNAVRLNIADLKLRPGTTYKGTLDLDPADGESSTLALSVRSTDGTWLAVALMVLGVLVGLFLAWTTSVWWRIHTLEAARKRAQNTFASRQEQFNAEPSRPHPLNNTTWKLIDDVTVNPGDLYRPLRLTIDPSDTRLAEIEKGIARLKLADHWGAPAAQELGALQAALTDFAPPASPPPGAPTRPGVMDAASQHLAPEPPANEIPLDGIETFRDRTVWLTTVLGAFPTDWAKTDQRVAVLERLDRDLLNRDERRLVQHAVRQLRAARWHLWHARSPEDLAVGKVDERLAAVDDTIAQVAEARPNRRRHAMEEDRPPVTPLDPIDLRGLVISASDVLDDAFDRVVAVGRSVLRPISLFLVLAVAIALAVLTGMPTIYGDGPWGTLGDYIAAVAWGVGAIAAFKAVDATLGLFWGTPAPPVTEIATPTDTPSSPATA